MGLGCGATCLKYLLIIFNSLFWIGGAAILGIGIWLAVDEDALENLDVIDPEGMNHAVWSGIVYTMIAVGAFIFMVAFFGTVGACCENRCMLITYSVLSGITLAVEIVCVVLAIVYSDEINAEIGNEMYVDITTKYTDVDDTNNPYVTSWNNVQTNMKCCGSYNFTDWHDNSNYGPVKSEPVPWTCCRIKDGVDTPKKEDVVNIALCYIEGRFMNASRQPNFNYLNNKGCHQALVEWVDDQSVIVYSVMIAVGCVQIFGIVFASIVVCAIKDANRYA